jgi:hypothetical protein
VGRGGDCGLLRPLDVYDNRMNAEPQPISLEDAPRSWNLQQQKAPLGERDRQLLHQAAEWQMWVSHGLRLPKER